MKEKHFIITDSCFNIRAVARQALEGKWKKAIIVCLIYTVCVHAPYHTLNLLFSNVFGTPTRPISIEGCVYYFLFIGVFALGLTFFFLSLFRNQELKCVQIFFGFRYFFKAIGLNLLCMLRIWLWAVLLIVPGIIAAIRYSQAQYILADDPSKGILQCIKESKLLMEGNKKKYFLLGLSFFGWVLMYIVVVGVIYIPYKEHFGGTAVGYVIGQMFMKITMCVLFAYMQTALVAFYDALLSRSSTT